MSMKFACVIVLLSGFISLSSCVKKTDPVFGEQPGILKASKDTIILNGWAGTDSLEITARDPWDISGIPSWLTVTPSSGTGNTKILLSYTLNPLSQVSRTALLTVHGVGTLTTITVIQNQANIKASAILVAGGGVGVTDGERGEGGYLDDIIGTHALFDGLYGLTCDVNGNLYVGDSWRIRKISATTAVSTVPGPYQHPVYPMAGVYDCWKYPGGLVTDKQGNLYVADRGDNLIYKCTPSGQISILAGDLTPGYADGTGTAARFKEPYDMVMDSKGDLIVYDNGNKRIRRVTQSGIVTTITGQSYSGFIDGPASAARLGIIHSLAIDASDNIYAADWGNCAVRKITPDGTVETLVSGRGIRDGILYSADMEEPSSIAVDKNGYVYVFDYWHKIRVITPKGMVYTLDDGRNWGYCIDALVIGPDNTLYIGAMNKFRIYKVIIGQLPE